MKRKLFGLLLLSVSFGALFGQEEHTLPQNQVKNSTPVSPEVASLGVFGIQPPSYSNGLPSVSVPIFEIKENGLSYPIELDYSSSGFRPTEESTTAGLGWMLNQGIITRVVRSLPDDNPSVMKKFESFNNNNDIQTTTIALTGSYNETYNLTANRIYNKIYDGSPDVYIYNFNGHTGKFLWINNQPVLLPYNDLKIYKTATTFVVSTPEGVEYTFQEADHIMTQARGGENNVMTTQYYAPECGGGDGTPTFNGGSGYTAAWILTRVFNKATKAEITFKYDYYSKQTTTDENDFYNVTIWGQAMLSGSPNAGERFIYDFHNYFGNSISQMNQTVFYLKEINSASSKVVINYNDRLDVAEAKAIENIVVYPKYGSELPVKKVAFVHDYFKASGTSQGWLKLKKLIFNDDVANSYEFDYEDETDVGPVRKKSCSIDHWSYYNHASNFSLVPKYGPLVNNGNQNAVNFSFNIDEIPWADRTPNFNYAKFFTLSKVQYPTKGYTKFFYESAGGRGIRLRAAEDYDGIKANKKYYSYYPDNQVPSPLYEYAQYTIGMNPPGSPFDPHLPNQTEAGPGTRYISISSTLYRPLDYLDEGNFYSKVTENIGTINGAGGSNVFHFDRDPASSKTYLIKTEKFAYGNTTPLDVTINHYTVEPIKVINFWDEPHFDGYWSNCDLDPEYRFYPLYRILVTSYGVASSWYKLDQVDHYTNYNLIGESVKTYFKPMDPLSGIPKSVLPIKTESIQSGGDLKASYFYYPGEIDPDNSSVVLGPAQMWDTNNPNFKNLTSPVLKTKSFTGTKPIETSFSEFTYDSANDLLLNTRYEEHPNSGTENKQWNMTYDHHANLLSTAQNLAPQQSFQWGYNNSLPVAIATNAAPGEFFFEGFEDRPVSIGAHTGDSYYQGDYLLNFAIPNNRVYKYSYWYSSAGSWHFSGEKSYTVPVTITDGDAIDDVRVYPEGAMLKTYTHKPLIGISTLTDERNASTFYEYDNQGRLLLIKDQNRKILKNLNYNHTTNVNEPAVYFNPEMSQSFTKAGCGTAYGVSLSSDPVPYTVPAGKFSSAVSLQDAIDQAQDDINKNGQRWVDENAVCGAKISVLPNADGVTANITSLELTNTITNQKITLQCNIILYGPPNNFVIPPGNYRIVVYTDTDEPDTFGHIEMFSTGEPQCYNSGHTYIWHFNANLTNGSTAYFLLSMGECATL